MDIVIFFLLLIVLITAAILALKEEIVKQVNLSKEIGLKGQVSISSGVNTRFAYAQLIGGERFMEQYKKELTALHTSKPFMAYISSLRQTLNGSERTDTRTANMAIADSFYRTNANEKFPPVAKIVAAVKTYGKQASAHISIYYAIYILDDLPF